MKKEIVALVGYIIIGLLMLPLIAIIILLQVVVKIYNAIFSQNADTVGHRAN